jgi:hypothetical protein
MGQMTDSATWKNSIEGPRWASFPTFLRDECWMRDLDLRIEVEKGWIRETVRFEIKGPKPEVDRFRQEVERAIEAYNK